MVAAALIATIALTYLLRRLLRPPPHLAPGLPVIPIWVAFLPLLRVWLKLPLPGQDETYARFIAPAMSKHGAVIIYFGSQWNVLVGCPQGMKQLFSEERDTYQKSGNHKKLPHAVISALTGGNIISESGAAWKKFAEVIRPALKHSVDLAGLEVSRIRLVEEINKINMDGGGAVGVTPLVQRYSMESVCLCVFGRDLKFLPFPPSIHTVHALVKRHIFHPLFLSVPALDSFPKLFPSRQVARDSIGKLETELLAALPSEEAKAALASPSSPSRPLTGKAEPRSTCVLRDLDQALLDARFTRREYIDNLKILFIAGHENAQQALCSLLMVIARDPNLQEDLRKSALGAANDPSTFRPCPKLHAVIHETLRLYPPIPQLINRRVARACTLRLPSLAPGKGIEVPLQEGTYVGWTAYGVHRGRFNTLWQPDPAAFRPARWGNTVEEIDTLARKARSAGEFVSFHGGLRACPGQPFALQSLHMSLIAILSNFRVHLVSEAGTELTPAGLLAPRNLQLRFEALVC